MYIIVVGCGRVGAQLACILAKDGHNVVVVDKNPDSFSRLGAGFNGVTVVGSGFDKNALLEAGIEKADAFAAVTNRDNTNIMAAQVAKGIFKIKKIVTRIYDPGREKTYLKLGLDVVGGTTLIAKLMRNKIIQTNYSSDSSVMENGDIKLINFLPTEALIGKTIEQVEKKNEFRIILVKKEKKLNMAERDYVINKNDIIYAMIKSDKITKYADYFYTDSVE
ncbi:MAG: TrkA family potassium uptake protein [bacterium]|nr:TrkA family potassium uptake protein [bacterium]